MGGGILSYAVAISTVGGTSRVIQEPRPRLRRPVRRPRSRSIDPSPWRRKYYWDGRGQYRVFNAAEYRFYRTLGSPPAESDAPFATSATLPHTPADLFADGEWYLSMSYFNGVIDSGFLPVGPLGETYKILRVVGGAQVNNRPTAPFTMHLELRSGGVVRVHAVYLETGTLRADTWAITFTTNGSTPGNGTPDVTVTMVTSGRGILVNDLAAQADGTTVKVRVQTSRDDGAGAIYSTVPTPDDFMTIVADAVGPTVPKYLERWDGLLPESL